MQISFDALDAGTKVFVQLGYLTVKHGQIVGHRVTQLSGRTTVEYLVKWFGGDDRPSPQEWFDGNRVRGSAEEAFSL